MTPSLLSAQERAAVRNLGLVKPLMAAALVVYAIARLLEIVPSAIPRTAIVALDVLSAMAFALVHGARVYRLRGILTFSLICLLVGNVIENAGVVTGFPFGRYYFVQLMGPKLFHVPILLGLAYIGMAYVSFALARTILGAATRPISGSLMITVPLLACIVMTAWDLAQDPVWSTVLHGWVWRDGGAWFGVPISNYLGWCGTNFVISVFFALYLRQSRITGPESLPGWPLLFYGLCAVANILQVLPTPRPDVVADPTGRLWRIADITRASALVSIFVMGAFVGLAWLRLARRQRTPTG